MLVDALTQAVRTEISAAAISSIEGAAVRSVNGKRITDKTISKVMEGTSFGASGCYTMGGVGYSQTLSNHPKDKNFHTFELGIGLGGNGGNINQEKTYKIGSLDGDK